MATAAQPLWLPRPLQAVRENEALSIVLVGIRSELEALLCEGHARIRIVEAADVVRMNERPSHALRHKKNSSMAIALGLVRDGEAQGCVSAGNTGALMAFGRTIIRMYPGIERPAIAKLIPSLRGRCHVLDLGANVDSTAENLYQYALMGSLMASAICSQAEPRVALLNVGEEEIKGNEQVRLASHMLAQCDSINYIGYVEGSDLFRDVADVVVCDGFVGNIALKTGEGVAGLLIELMEQAFTPEPLRQAGRPAGPADCWSASAIDGSFPPQRCQPARPSGCGDQKPW